MKFFHLLLCLGSALALTTRADALTLYASTAAGAAGELYIIDQANGALVQDIGPLNDASSVNYGMTGLAFQPSTGVLFGSTAANIPATAAKLVTINPATGLVTVVGSYGVANGSTMADLAFDPTSGVLYGIGTNGGAHLYSIDTTTGAATLVGNSGFAFTNGGGVAVSATGTVFSSPLPANFGTYDKVTGAYTDIANPVKPTGRGYGALAFDGSILYGLNVGTATLAPHLVTIDPATGAVADLGTSINSLDAIAFQPAPAGLTGDYNNNGKVDAADYPLWRKNNGTSNSLGPNDPIGVPITLAQYTQWRSHFGNPGPGAGSAVVAVPEPSAIILVAVGMLLRVIGKRSRCR